MHLMNFTQWHPHSQAAAKPLLSDTAWGYYSSAAEEGSSHTNNLASYARYEFRPRWYVKPKNDSLTELHC